MWTATWTGGPGDVDGWVLSPGTTAASSSGVRRDVGSLSLDGTTPEKWSEEVGREEEGARDTPGPAAHVPESPRPSFTHNAMKSTKAAMQLTAMATTGVVLVEGGGVADGDGAPMPVVLATDSPAPPLLPPRTTAAAATPTMAWPPPRQSNVTLTWQQGGRVGRRGSATGCRALGEIFVFFSGRLAKQPGQIMRRD